jgi:hypothetical protein
MIVNHVVYIFHRHNLIPQGLCRCYSSISFSVLQIAALPGISSPKSSMHFLFHMRATRWNPSVWSWFHFPRHVSYTITRHVISWTGHWFHTFFKAVCLSPRSAEMFHAVHAIFVSLFMTRNQGQGRVLQPVHHRGAVSGEGAGVCYPHFIGNWGGETKT